MKLGVAAALVDGLLVKGDVEVLDGRISSVGLASRTGHGIAIGIRRRPIGGGRHHGLFGLA